MAPHSTQRTLPPLCSSSVTLSEIMRLCTHVQNGLIGKDSGWPFELFWGTMHLQESKSNYLANVHMLYLPGSNY